jgi:hypothetical protein
MKYLLRTTCPVKYHACKQAVLLETPDNPKQEDSVETLFFAAKRPELGDRNATFPRLESKSAKYFHTDTGT